MRASPLFGVLLALVLVGCGKAPASQTADTPGARLEAAAVSAGLVPDAVGGDLTGSYARDTDRVCVVPTRENENRIGVVVDFGDGQACSASGNVTRSADKLGVELGNCRFVAKFDGEHIVFPPILPAGCDNFCSGRASLAALDVARLSDSASEAATLRNAFGTTLCAPVS